MPKTALVLEGGGMRSLYTAGVLDALLKAGVHVDTCIGVSAGACNGMSFVSEQIGRNYRINTNYTHDPRYLSVQSLIKTGSMFGMTMIFHTIPNELDPFDWNRFAANPTKMVAGVTNCYTGKSEFMEIRSKKDMPILQASSSLPLVAKPMYLNGIPYMDGGISSSIPVGAALKDHDKAIVVLTRHRNFKKKPENLALLRQKYPDFAGLYYAMKNRQRVYTEEQELLKEYEQQGRAFVIAPKIPLKSGRMEKNRKKLNELYLQGYAEGTALAKDALAFVTEA